MRHPTAIISWAHTSPGWSARKTEAHQRAVIALSTTLRGNGIDVDLDLYHLSSSVDWTRWGPQRVAECDFVLVVVSGGWRLAWEGHGDPSRGAGAAAETDVLRSTYVRNRGAFLQQVRLVLLPGAQDDDIPNGLHGVPRFPVGAIDDAGVHDLLRSLTGQPAFVMSDLGALPELPPSSSAPGPEAVTKDQAGSPTGDRVATGPAAEMSPGRRNALAQAWSYLGVAAFSEEGLVRQLTSEGFSPADARHATAETGADWGAQATRKAHEYLSITPFSERGLAQQLTSDGFSAEQSERAAADMREDWDAQAARKASQYLSFTSFSRSALARQLVFDGFTHEEAETGVATAYQ